MATTPLASFLKHSLGSYSHNMKEFEIISDNAKLHPPRTNDINRSSDYAELHPPRTTASIHYASRVNPAPPNSSPPMMITEHHKECKKTARWEESPPLSYSKRNKLQTSNNLHAPIRQASISDLSIQIALF
jgi:hypothetical protein